MPLFKRKYRSGQIIWAYEFNLPGATRDQRVRVSGSGFPSKREAAAAEVARAVEEQRKRDLAQAGAAVAVAPPTTLAMLLREFMTQHAEEKLAPKTVERYRQQAAYLHPDLLSMPLDEITPAPFEPANGTGYSNPAATAEKIRRRSPMSAKTVRNMAGVVSSAFSRALMWGLLHFRIP